MVMKITINENYNNGNAESYLSSRASSANGRRHSTCRWPGGYLLNLFQYFSSRFIAWLSS